MKEIKPKIVPQIKIEEQYESYTDFEPLPGEYHMIGIDDKGNEIQGSDFSIGERTYNRTYKNNPQFKTKKKPQ